MNDSPPSVRGIGDETYRSINIAFASILRVQALVLALAADSNKQSHGLFIPDRLSLTVTTGRRFIKVEVSKVHTPRPCSLGLRDHSEFSRSDSRFPPH